jgi:hypothetical protein
MMRSLVLLPFILALVGAQDDPNCNYWEVGSSVMVGNYTLTDIVYNVGTPGDCELVDVAEESFALGGRATCVNDSVEISLYTNSACTFGLLATATFESGDGINFRCGEYTCRTIVRYTSDSFPDSTCTGFNASALTTSTTYELTSCFLPGYDEKDAKVWCDTGVAHFKTYKSTSNVFKLCTDEEETYDVMVGDCFPEYNSLTEVVEYHQVLAIACGAPGYEGSDGVAVWSGLSVKGIVSVVMIALWNVMA